MLFLKPVFCILVFTLEGHTEGQFCLKWKIRDHVSFVPRSCGAQPEPPLGEQDAPVSAPSAPSSALCPQPASAPGCSIENRPTIHKKRGRAALKGDRAALCKSEQRYFLTLKINIQF